MKQHPRVLEILDRAETGPLMEEVDFERRLVGPTIKELISKYDIQYDGNQLVNENDALADRVFHAGLDFAEQVGMFNQSTSRRITWSKSELTDGIENCFSETTLGEGEQTYTIKARKPEDAGRIATVGGVVGIPFPEEQLIPLTLSFLKQGLYDCVDTASLETAYGYPIKAGTGWEVLGAYREAELALTASGMAGVPGTPFSVVELSPTALGGLSGVTWGAFRPTDRHHLAVTSEFKINNDLLAIMVHAHNMGATIGAYYNPIYGGHFGGAEGVAIAVAAGILLMNQTYVAHTFSTRPTHPFFGCDTTREILWATSLGLQAISRNSNLMVAALAGPCAGPGTKTMVYENASFALMAASSGVSEMLASHSAGGAVPRHGSGLDARICAEIVRSCGDVSRNQANEWVRQLVPLYENEFGSKPVGKPFEEVYDLETVEPTDEWQGMYDEVREELIRIGVPLDQLN
jgi:methylamine---corrinoid protein Co-methyltransferase